MLIAYVTGDAPDILDINRGLLLPSPDLWFLDHGVNFGCALTLLIGSTVLMVVLNRIHNLHRSLSETWAALFLIACAAMPAASVTMQGGLLLLPIILIDILLLFSAYQQPWLSRRIFLAYFITTWGAVVDYGFVPYLLLLYIGLLQMRILNLRTILSSLTGIAVPVWLLWAFGLIGPDSWHIPEFVNIFKGADVSQTACLLTVTAVTAFSGIIFGFLNLLDIYSKNARTRAFNGLIIVTGCLTAILCAADFGNLLFYLPLLTFCTAYQAGLFYSLRAKQRPYIPILTLVGIYAALYLWMLCT